MPVNLTGKIIPLNAGFVGMVDSSQVLSVGVSGNLVMFGDNVLEDSGTSPSGIIGDYALLLDQSTSQTIINGTPTFDRGLMSNTDVVASGAMTAGAYFITDGNVILYRDGADNLTFTDPITGTKTLAELSSSGAMDHSLLNNLAWSTANHTIDTDISIGTNAVVLAEITTPSNPPANELKIYAKASGSVTRLHTLDSAGIETVIGISSVTSVFGRGGNVTAQTGDYAWANIDKTISDIGDITTKSHTSLDDIGTNTHADIDTHIDSAAIAVHSAASNLVFNTGNQSIGGVKTFTDLPESSILATTDNQLVNLALLNTIAQGLIPKAAVAAGTTEDITLSSLQTIDTYITASGNRVLVKDQSNPIENGIYVASPGSWDRSSDYDQTPEIKQGTFTIVLEGNVNINTQWVQYALDPVVNVDPILFRPLPQIEVYTAASGVKKNMFEFSLDMADTFPALEIADGGVRIAVDDSSIGRNASGIYVKPIGITNSMLAGSIENGKLNQISASDKVTGSSLTLLGGVSMYAGIIPVVNLASGVPTGDKFIRDDGTFAVPPGAGASGVVQSIVAGTNITVDSSDSANPIVAASFTPTTPYAEVPSGSVDGFNVTFTLAHTPLYPSSVIIVIDGVTQYYIIDYTVSGATITFTYAPMSGSTIFAYYGSTGTTAAQFAGLSKITVGKVQPTSPSVGDLWVDTN